ncbi:GNAT family N-acetyltransferase [Humibacter soli]
MIEIDVVGENDWARWRSLRLQALKEAPFAFGSTYEEWRGAPEGQWRQRLRIPDALNLIASVNGLPAGMASGMPGDRPETIELVSMWVDPSARGMGVADILIASVSEWAAIRARELWLAVVPSNTRAIAVYTRNGFDLMDEPGDPLRDGSGHELLMRKVCA